MYVALYRKYRPKTFGDVLSQNHITSTLKNEIKLKKIAHAYIFTGPRGTGKTSCAKIFSKAINCEKTIEGEPCCKCDMCLAIDSESILDVTEMDGASNNSVNTIRSLRDEANFVPAVAKYRIYIIDEAHMLSSSAFNALLKIMEEPPRYVIFILATTEIYKLPKTIISRCQRFDFGRIKIKDLEERLGRVCSLEGVTISQKALKKIATLSDGSMRDSLSMLDKCIIGRKSIDIDVVEDLLNIVSDDYIFGINEAIKDKNIHEAIKIINNLYEGGKDLEYFILELLEFYHEMIYYNIFGEEAKSIIEYNKYLDCVESFSCLSDKEIIFVEEKFLACYEKIKSSSNKKLRLELTLLEICEAEKKYKTDVELVKKEDINSKKNFENIYSSLEEFKGKYVDLKEFLENSKLEVADNNIKIKLSKKYPERDILKYNKFIIDLFKGKFNDEYSLVLENKKENLENGNCGSVFDKFLNILKENDINIEFEK